MKKSITIFCLLLLAGFIGTIEAQDAVMEKPVLTADQNQAVNHAISMDPKLSAEEIEQLKIAVLGAPAKAELAIDPKQESQPEVVAAPWKAEPAVEREEVLPEPVTPSGLTHIQAGKQPIPANSDNEINLHSLSIPGAVQLEAPKSETVIPDQPAVTPGVNPQAGPNGN